MNGSEYENECERIVFKVKISSGLFCIVLVCQNHREMNLRWNILKPRKRTDKSRQLTHQMNLKIECVCVACVLHMCDRIISLSIARRPNNRTFHSFCAQSADTIQICNTNTNYLFRLKICWKSLAAHDDASSAHQPILNFNIEEIVYARTGQSSCNRCCCCCCRVRRCDL